MKGLLVAMIAAFCVVYLINPTWGFLELIPDNLPIVGNLDEVGVTAILLACLRYFGVDWAGFLGRKRSGGALTKDEVLDMDE